MFAVQDILSSCEGSSSQGSWACHTLLFVNITALVLIQAKEQKLVKPERNHVFNITVN